MPQKSDRRRAIEWMKKVSLMQKNAIEREVLSDNDSIQDEEDENMNSILKRIKKHVIFSIRRSTEIGRNF
jgi:hypothetical protein